MPININCESQRSKLLLYILEIDRTKKKYLIINYQIREIY